MHCVSNTLWYILKMFSKTGSGHQEILRILEINATGKLGGVIGTEFMPVLGCPLTEKCWVTIAQRYFHFVFFLKQDNCTLYS